MSGSLIQLTIRVFDSLARILLGRHPTLSICKLAGGEEEACFHFRRQGYVIVAP